jgi:hypothetical protein
VNLGNFGKQAILWGAGLSKVWGGFLAEEFWGYLQGRTALDSFPRLRDLLATESSFETALDLVTTGAFSDEERRALWNAVMEVFAILDEHLAASRQPPRPPVDEGRFLRFLAAFKPDRSPASSGYLFTLNQDVLLEGMGSHLPGDAEPRCPAVFPSQGAFSFRFRGPFLLDGERQVRPVPGHEPPEGWPSLTGGLHYIKLHGSAAWKTATGNYEFVIGGGKSRLIDRSPLLSWYREIFRAVTSDGDVRMLIVGYGFRDEHINDVLAEGIAAHGLTLYVVGSGTSGFRSHLDARLLPGLRGYVGTPLTNIIGDGPPDTPAMVQIRRFLRR